jgi:hypothetical protein
MNYMIISLSLIIISNFARIATTQSGKRPGSTLAMKIVSNPTASGSSQPRLTVTPDGRALLSWLEPVGPKGMALKFAVQEKSGWSAPRIVASGRPFMTHASVQPAVTLLADGSLVAYWSENRQLRVSDRAKRIFDPEDIYFSNSRDGGKAWAVPVILHRDMSDCEHSFLSIAPLADDQVAAIWLDGRDKTYAVRHSVTKTSGGPGEETVLDADVCTCCPTAMARTGEGLIVAYRDHTGETRDISYVRFAQGRWHEPQPLHHDGWKINGCPNNGVDLDAEGQRVAAAWFTAANDQTQVKVSFSNDAGKSFSAPVRIDEGRPAGRAAVAAAPDGGGVIAWIERGEKQSKLLARHVSSDGRLGPSISLGQIAKSFPRLVRLGGQAMLTWTEAGSTRTALLSIQAQSATK